MINSIDYKTQKISVIGSTTWGTALAILNSTHCNQMFLVTRTEEEENRLTVDNQNRRFLPHIMFPNNLTVTSSYEKSLNAANIIIIAVPSNSMRPNLINMAPHISKDSIIISATKGLEKHSGLRMTELIKQELPTVNDENLSVLSGPNLAKEVMQGKPCSSVIASFNTDLVNKLQNILNSESFRIYGNSDVIGVELSGAMKNIVAIAAGICDGLELGDNAKSSLITRGLSEMSRLGKAEGANQSTFAGISGIGDLIATCSSKQSRNNTLGYRLAKGEQLIDIENSTDNVIEGISTSKAVMLMAKKHDLSLPLMASIHDILFNNITAEMAYKSLMIRPIKHEY
jgi:glycerol-3-phosphate dehydrogenase (NAD(P)+)